MFEYKIRKNKWKIAFVIALVAVSLFAIFYCPHNTVYALSVENATCIHEGVENMVCEKCEAVVESHAIEAHGHEFGEYEMIVNPGNGTDGLEVRTCSICNEREARICVCPHSWNRAETTKESTCSENGITAIICRECDTTIDELPKAKLECEFGEWEVISESTCLEYGVKQRACINCGKTEEEYLDFANCDDFSLVSSVYNEADNTMTYYYECICGNTKQNTEKLYWGFVGTLNIESVGLTVNTYNSMEQSVCDRKNSACYFSYNGVKVIGDHWNQGFEKIKSCSVGDIATIGDRTYVCVEVFYGHNTEYSLTDNDYNDITSHEGDLFMYTCNGCWQNIAITAWNAI